MNTNILKVGLVQQKCTDDPEANLDKCIMGIRDAANQGAQLVLLQELHNSLYFCQTEDTSKFDLAEPIPGPTTDRLARVAQETGTVVISSIFEKRAAGLYHNTAVVLDSDGSMAGMYRKMHIPDDPGFYEKFYFTPGDLGFRPVKTSVGILGVLVCWDQWYPEAARLMALAGADFLLYPTAIGWDPRDNDDEKTRQLDSWITIQRAHAVANGIPVLSCNRTGTEKSPDNTGNSIEFWGNSFIAGPQGEILAQAENSEEFVLVAEINKERSENTRRIWPFLRDRRIDSYHDLVKRFID
jgi:N-carbamoylputrescine amidase